MKRRGKGIFKTVITMMLALVMVLTIIDRAPVQAADNNTKVVYSVKQLKKALKAKAAATVVFRTETYDNVTIPKVKAAKNKDLIIIAGNAGIKNKAKCNTITVNNVNQYTEAVSGNTIIWKDHEFEIFEIAKKIKVNNLIFKKWDGIDPEYVIRKGAKIKDVSIETDYTVSNYDSKTRTLSVDYLDSRLESGSFTVAKFKFDKSGRILESELHDDYNFLDSYDSATCYKTYKYDKNGNLTEYNSDYEGDYTYSVKREYDSDNNLIMLSSSDNSDSSFKSKYKYDSNGNKTYYAILSGEDYANYEYLFQYDKKGRCVEEWIKQLDYKCTYKYDSNGRRTEMHSVGSNEDDLVIYDYDKNGLLIERTENIKGYGVSIEKYVYDSFGNRIYSVFDTIPENGEHDNSMRTEYYYNEYIGDYPVYEDGFVSPVNNEYFDKKTYENAGYTVVSSVEELLNAIAPGAKIIIEPGYYNMSLYIENTDSYKIDNPYIYIDENFVDGKELVIYDCDDLLISGGSAYRGDTTLVIDPRYSAVIKFEKCNDLKLSSFTCGHTNRGTCEGNVIDLYQCKNVDFYNMDMFGCGVYGLGADVVTSNVNVYNSIIHDCSAGPFCFNGIQDSATFTNCVFYGSEGGGYWSKVYDDSRVTFKKCSFGEEETNSLSFQDKFDFIDCFWSEVTRYPEYGY